MRVGTGTAVRSGGARTPKGTGAGPSDGVLQGRRGGLPVRSPE